jgi:uncharacterized protein (TIGR00255 family)
MIQSMTGFGRAETEKDTYAIRVEVKALNSKTFDLNLRLSSMFKENEFTVRNILNKHLDRGRIDCSISYEKRGSSAQVKINKDLAKVYFNELKALADELKQSSADLITIAVKMPDVISTTEEVPTPEMMKHVETLVEEVVKQVMAFRAAEGKSLEADLNGRVNQILACLDDIEKHEPQRLKQISDRIKNSIGEMEFDKNRFEQELIYYIEKMDFSEEKVRLKSHCKFFRETMKSEELNGRKLTFISQEMGREINTLGSKANHADIQKSVVQMKDELEKLKEQLLNVL